MNARTGTALLAAIATLGFVICAGAATRWAIAIHTPCGSNLEGGCGYAKMWAGLFSFIAAAAALVIASAMLLTARALQWPGFVVAVWCALAITPLGYVGYCIYHLVVWVYTVGI